MKNILLFGAGKSATHLIEYLLQHARSDNWILTVADANASLARQKIGSHSAGKVLQLDITDIAARRNAIGQADIVISMMPAFLHGQIASDCVELGRHLLTASYVDNDMRQLEPAIAGKNILVLCEMGLDPGIDHMSAMEMINNIHALDGKIKSFRSHCGGLVAPESDNNPWHYKISWNPRNIILAGKAGAIFRKNAEKIFLSYEELYAENRTVHVPDLGPLSWYPNRDSISYEALYGLTDAEEFIRTTLRHADFMDGWNKLIQLRLTDELPLPIPSPQSVTEWFSQHIQQPGLKEKLSHFKSQSATFRQQWEFLDLEHSTLQLNKPSVCAADFLQAQCEEKMKLDAGDKDLVVMLHEIDFETSDALHSWKSSLVVKGEDPVRTAMSKTVGLPLAIACRLILNGTIQTRGLHIPSIKEIYEPVLKELAKSGVAFREEKSVEFKK